MKVVEEIVKWMRNNGVKRFFGIPGGGSSLELINEAERQGIRFFLASHEGSAGIMAAVTGDLEKNVGVACSIMGPGALNVAFAIGHSKLENLPLILFTERFPESSINKISSQRLSHQALFSDLVKWHATIYEHNVHEILESAYHKALECRPGPVHIDIPNDIILKESNCRSVGRATEKPQKVDLKELDAFVNKIENSERPVLLIGAGAKNSDISLITEEFINKINIPFLPTFRGRGIVTEEHPLFGGVVFGLDQEGSFENTIISLSDLIIQIGVDKVEIPRVWPYKQETIIIDTCDIGEETVGAPSIKLLGNIREILTLIVADIRNRKCWNENIVSDLWSQLLEKIDHNEDKISPESVITTVRDLFPGDGVCVTETGVFNMMMGHLWRVYVPDSYICSSGNNTMGFALPAMIAAKLSVPLRKVVGFMGDGSLLMRAGELEGLSRVNGGTVAIVFKDGGLGTIKMKMKAQNYNLDSLDFSDVNFSELARVFSINSVMVKSLKGFKDEFKKALNCDKPTIIEVLVDVDTYDNFIKEIRSNSKLN